MANRRAFPFSFSIVFVLLTIPCVVQASPYVATDQASLEQALLAASAGDTVLVTAGLQGGIARLHAGIHLICETPYAASLKNLEVVDLAHETVVEGFLLSGLWPPPDNPPPAVSVNPNVYVHGSQVSFQNCHFDGLYYQFNLYYKTELEPIPDIDPVSLVDSEVQFLQCEFRHNGGDVALSEGPSFGCVRQAGTGVTTFMSCLFEEQPFPISVEGPVAISGSTFRNCGPGLILSESSITLTGSLIVGCGPSHYLSCYSCDVGNSYAYARSIEAHGQVQFESNTFVDNPIVDWYMGKPTVMENPEIYIPLIDLGDAVTGNISHNLFIGQTGPAVSGPATIEVSCNDAWQSQTELWTGGMGDVTDMNGNISQAPTFCSREEGDYSLSVYSPAATAPCGLMGAFPTACETPVPVAVQDFSAHWVGSGVRLQWKVATENSCVAIVERLDGDGLREIYRGEASSFLDPTPSVDASLQYALGLVLDGQEMNRISWAKPSGAPLRARTRLFEAQPNPFNPSTTIRFELERAAHAKLQVFNLSGRLVATLVDGECQAGMNEVTWQGRDAAHSMVSSGIYLYSLRVGRYLETKRMVLLK